MTLRAVGLDLVVRSLSGVTVGLLDDQLRLVDIAGAWLERTGTEPAEVIGRPLAEWAGAEIAERCSDGLRSALAGETVHLRMRNPVHRVDSGAPRWFDLVLRPAPGPEPRAFFLLRNVSDELLLADELSAAEQRLEQLGAGAEGVALVGLDTAGVVSVWTDAAERMLGFGAATIVGRHLATLLPADEVTFGTAHALLRRAAVEGSVGEEVILLDVDGDPLRCQLLVRALRSGEGDRTGYTCVVRDLTEQRRAALTAQVRERLLRAVFDDAPTGMAVVEQVEGGGWRVLEANAALAGMVGHPVSSLVADVMPSAEDPADGVTRPLFDLVAREPGRRRELDVVRPDGSRRSVLVGLVPLGARSGGADDGPVRYVAQVSDVTARREAERAVAEALVAERRTAEELRELQRLRADFLATVSHELRTPLSSVLGYAELFADGDLGAVSPAQARAIDGLSRNAARLEHLIGDLLLMSSVEQGTLRPGRRHARVDAALERAVEQVRGDAEARDIALTASAPPGVSVPLEPRLLDTVMIALLSNAVKFTGVGGAVEAAVTDGDDGVEIVVADSGVGIPPADLPHVFDPFFRGSTSERLAVAGTGLGLSLVRKVVEIHGGRVAVESELGHGARFSVRLPRAFVVHSGAA